METLYDALKVKEDAPPEVIKAAYKVLSSMFHPDKNPDEAKSNEAMKKINAAYRVLRDPEKRAGYDDLLRRSRARAESQENEAGPQTAKPDSASNDSEKTTEEEINKEKKNFDWTSTIGILIGVVLSRIIGGIGAVTFCLVFYWVYKKRGAIVSSLLALISAFAVSSLATVLVFSFIPKETKEYFGLIKKDQPPAKSFTYEEVAGDLNEQNTAPPKANDEFDNYTGAQTALKSPESEADKHYRRIMLAHPDANQIAASKYFIDWIRDKPNYQFYMQQGTTEQVIEAITAFKNWRDAPVKFVPFNGKLDGESAIDEFLSRR